MFSKSWTRCQAYQLWQKPPVLSGLKTVTWEEILIAHLHAGAETPQWISLCHKARVSRKLRKNTHSRESSTGRVSSALRVNHADVSVRGFYPKSALYAPGIRWRGTRCHQLREQRRPPGVPCAAVTPLPVPVPGAAVAPAGHTQAGLLPLQECLTWHKSFSRFLHSCFLSAAVPCCCHLLLLLLRCFGDVTATDVPAARGDVKPPQVKASLQPTCDRSVSYQQHESVPLDAWQSWASGKAHDANYFRPLAWDIWTSLGISDDHILQTDLHEWATGCDSATGREEKAELNGICVQCVRTREKFAFREFLFYQCSAPTAKQQ